jgi:hypothetical protein
MNLRLNSGIGLPHPTTSRTEWHAETSRLRHGVRQSYAAFLTLATVETIESLLGYFGLIEISEEHPLGSF